MTTQKCIWMDCGYVEYKLCDRNFDCENCPFDQAIKQERKLMNHDEITFDSNEDQKFIFPNHIWISKRNNILSLGLNAFAQKIFTENCSINFPLIGSKLFEGKTFLWVIGSFGAVGFHSPIDGNVIWINQKIKANPFHFFSTNAFTTDLIKVESNSKLDESNLFTTKNYTELINQDSKIVKDFLVQCYSRSQKQLTLADGREFIKDYFNELSNQEYLKLLKLIFHKKI